VTPPKNTNTQFSSRIFPYNPHNLHKPHKTRIRMIPQSKTTPLPLLSTRTPPTGRDGEGAHLLRKQLRTPLVLRLEEVHALHVRKVEEQSTAP
jgi:hypothetical protein